MSFPAPPPAAAAPEAPEVVEALPDATLAEAEEKVLTMLELSAQIAEGLSAGLAAEAAPTAAVAADAARFAELAAEVEDALAGARFVADAPYQRTADAELFRRRVDDAARDAASDLEDALRAHARGAAAAGGAAPEVADAAYLVRACERTAAAAGVRAPGSGT